MENSLSKLKVFILNYQLLLLFTLFLGIGLYNLDDYGISWDEEAQREIGLFNYNYAFKGDTALKTFESNDHGSAFEIPLLVFEKAFRTKDSRSIYLLRHFLSHFFFLIGAFFCAKLVRELYKNNFLTFVSFLLVVLCPRFYEDSFVNTKDIPFLSLFFICFYFIYIAFTKMKPIYFALLGVSLGVTISLRVMGAMLFLSVLFFLLLDLVRSSEPKKTSFLLLTFMFTSLLALYISWPYLWESPLVNFKKAFESMSKYGWKGDNLFMGKSIDSSKLGWNYIPVWFCITIPMFYLVSGAFGIFLITISFFKKFRDFFDNTSARNNLYYLICFFAPIIAVILFKSVLYDGWRHLYFIYAPFVLLIIYCLNALHQSKAKKAIILIFSAYLLFITYSMVKIHPYQNVYFNELMDKKTPGYLRANYELDYWGVSYRQILEYILANDTSSKINIVAQNEPGIFNAYILESIKRKRLHFTSMDSASYFITNFRWHPAEYSEIGKPPLKSINVYNNSICSVYKLK